jgi:GNAT superfamily N-acetyltransferase
MTPKKVYHETPEGVYTIYFDECLVADNELNILFYYKPKGKSKSKNIGCAILFPYTNDNFPHNVIDADNSAWENILVDFVFDREKNDYILEFKGLHSLFNNGILFSLDRINIDREHRGKGLMPLMIEAIEKRYFIGGCMILSTCVGDGKTKLSEYYQTLGFKKIDDDGEFLYRPLEKTGDIVDYARSDYRRNEILLEYYDNF